MGVVSALARQCLERFLPIQRTRAHRLVASSGFGYSSPWANTLVMPTAQQPPVYPFLLAGIFKLAGIYSYRALWIALGLNALFSSITAVVILQLGKRTFDKSTGVLAAWIWSCWI
jgi:4-amino-4-deoxy-L-arabinose transferase-like glycosyltransferase